MTDPASPAFWSLTEADSRRTLLLCAVGAVVGLLVAGAGLFTARGTRTSVVPPEDVAIVNQVPILRSDYITQLRALYDVGFGEATPAQRRQVLNDMIREELYVQRGLELGAPTDDIDVRRTLVTSTEGAAVQDAMNTEPDEPDLRRYFSENAAHYANEGSIALEDWVLPADRAAIETGRVAQALRAGTSPATLGLKETGRVNGLEFYWAAKLHIGPHLFGVAEQLPTGGVSAPVTDRDGVHFLIVRQNVLPIPARYEDVRSQVLANYRQGRADRVKTGNDQFLRKRADIRIANDLQ